MTRRWAVAAVAVLAAAIVPALAVADSSSPSTVDLCRAAAGSSKLSSADRTWAQRCVRVLDEGARVLASPSPSPSPTVSASPSPSPTASPSQTPSPSPTVAGWPGPDNTGVPAGTVLTDWTGPCTITTPDTVIDSRTVRCDLSIATTGVVIRRSHVLGAVGTGESSTSDTLRLTVEDSTVDGGHRQVTTLGADNFVARRVEVLGGNRGVYCRWKCVLADSWVHGTYVESTWHASAVRAERYSTLVHNTLACDWLIPTSLDGGCSADLTGYGDFAAPHDWTIQGNLFVANPSGAAFCSYGGSSAGKPYSSDPVTGTNIVFADNVFQRGSNANCAAYGPITDFNPSKPGAVWSGNVWDDGSTVTP